jgi:FMN reductase
VKLVAVSGADSPTSKTRALVKTIVDERGGELIDLLDLAADGLLGRREDDGVATAVAAATNADVLIVATPVYRATYTGAIKAFFDRFAPRALANTAVVLVATAGIKEHFLTLDTGGRSLIASLEGWTVPQVVYATGDDFPDGNPSRELLDKLRSAVEQAELVAGELSAVRQRTSDA